MRAGACWVANGRQASGGLRPVQHSGEPALAAIHILAVERTLALGPVKGDDGLLDRILRVLGAGGNGFTSVTDQRPDSPVAVSIDLAPLE